MKKKKKKLPTYYNKLFPILLLIATFFMGTAYASMNSTALSIRGDAVAIGQDGLFITKASIVDSSGIDITNTKAVAYQTMLDSTIELSPEDSSSYVTYEITVFNSFDIDFTFLDVVYDSAFYDNSNIVYVLDGIASDDVVASKKEKTFKITFKYRSGVTPSENNNILNAYLNFRFIHPVVYIESSGTQYIDTGIVPDSTTDYNITFALHSVHQTAAILGSRTAEDSTDSYNLWLHKHEGMERYKLRFDSNGTTGQYFDLPVNEWKKVNAVKSGNTITMSSNGQTMSKTISTDLTGTNSIYIFSQNQSNTSESRKASMKLYDFKIYKAGALVRDYVPVLDQNGTACLYDKVSSSYFYNAGSGELGYSMHNNIYDYVQSSGTQYIDLEVTANSNMEVQFVMALNDSYSGTNSIFGARDGQVTNSFNMFWYNSSLRWDFGSVNDYPGFSANVTLPTFVLANATNVFANSEVKTYSYSDSFSSTNNMYLFAINENSNTIYINEGMKIYYFKVLHNGEVVRNLVPVTDSDGVPCFYDLVSQHFFYNKGTGSFTVG